MADTALLQHLAALIAALWFTKAWLVDRPPVRWRYSTAGLISTLLWIVTAFTALGAQTGAGDGSLTVFASLPVAYFAGFMAAVSVIGTVLGLLVWSEETLRETAGSSYQPGE